MKRLISMLLAFALLLTFVPPLRTFATDVETAAERVYSLNMNNIDKTLEGVWDKTLQTGAWQSSIVPVTGFGTHGFKYWTADTATYDASTQSRVLQLMTPGFRMYGTNEGKALLSNHDGIRVAIAFEKPSSVPSFYSIKAGRTSTGTVQVKAAEIYASPLIEENKDITHYMSAAARNGDTYSFGSSVEYFSELIYNNGTGDHVISFYTGNNGETGENKYGLNLQINSLTLTPAPVTEINLSLSSSYCFMGEEAKASVTATYKNASDKNVTSGVVDSYVKYESSNTDVATISADGTITPVANGTTTITATVGEFSASQTFTVGTKEYSFIKSSIAASDWDSTLTTTNMQSTIVPLIGYGDHGYKYWNADNASVENIEDNVRTLQYYGGGLRVWSFGNETGEEFTNPNGAKLAIALETPPKGFYEIKHTSGSSDGQIKKLDIHMTEISSADEAAETRIPVESFLTSENLVKTGSSSNTGAHSYNKIIAPSGENNLIWAVSVDPESKFSISKLQLTTLDVSSITLEADASAIELTETTTVNAKANDKKIAHSFVTYESLNPTVAKVAEDGTVTALAAGEATIKATAGGLSATTTITVKPEAAGEALSGTVTLGIFTNYTEAAAGVDAGDYSVNYVDGTTINIDTTVTAEANDIEGYRFAYWKDGSRFLSADNKITVTIARNTSLTAVYDVVSESAATKTVEFWNADKSFISSVTTEEDTVAALPENPEMTGMRFIGWYLDDETPFTPETVIKNGYTRVAAKYETLDTEYTVKVNGEENKGTYNSPVSVSAPEAFTYWKLGEEKLSFRRAFEFFNYGNAELISVVDEEAKAIPTVVIDKNLGAAFITYDTPAGYERIEAGIIFGNSAAIDVNSAYSKASAKNTAAFGQFTAKPKDGETYARGYQIFKKDGKIRVIYTDAIEVE